jgi:hypothetical protein
MRDIDEFAEALTNNCVLYNQSVGLKIHMMPGGGILTLPPITPKDPESAALYNIDPKSWVVCTTELV